MRASYDKAEHLHHRLPGTAFTRRTRSRALGYVYARAGARPQAEQILAALRRRQITQYVPPIDVAYVCLGLGDADGVMAQLELESDARYRAIRMVIVGDPF